MVSLLRLLFESCASASASVFMYDELSRSIAREELVWEVVEWCNNRVTAEFEKVRRVASMICVVSFT